MEQKKKGSSKSHAATRSIPGNGDKFEIARRSTSISVHGPKRSKSRASVKDGLFGQAGETKFEL